MLQAVKWILFVLHVALATTYSYYPPRETSTEVYDVTTIYHVGSMYNNTAKENRVEVHLRTNAKGLPINYGGWKVDDSVIGRHFPTCQFGWDWNKIENHCSWTTEGWNLILDEHFFPTGDSEIKRFILNEKFSQVEKLPRKMKVELKGYFKYGSNIYVAFSPNKKLLRDLSGFYRFKLYCGQSDSYLHYCMTSGYVYSSSYKDTDGELFYVDCNIVAVFGEFKNCIDDDDENTINNFYLYFSNGELQIEYQEDLYIWKPSPLNNEPFDAKYFTISYSGDNSHNLEANCIGTQALESNITNPFPLISPWFTADMDALCLAIVVNGIGRAEINITAENIAQEIYTLDNFIELYEPGSVFHLKTLLPKHLKEDRIRLILSVHDDMSPITIQRISSCNGEERSDIAVLDFKEDVSKVAYDVNTRSNSVDEHWPSKYVSAKIHPNITNTFNGGYQINTRFACPPGYTGSECKRACGRNRFGGDCKGVCSIYSYECQGLLLCTPAIGCQCAPGYSGANCENRCHEGNYGNDCKQVCGNCENQRACDIYTGYCVICDSGYLPPFCKETYPVVKSPPEVFISSYGQVKVTPRLTEYNGTGIPSMYQIQYKETGMDKWIAQGGPYYTDNSFDYDEIAVKTNNITITIKDLDYGKFYEVRTVLFDNNFNSYQGENVPITTFLSLCSIPVEVDYHITAKSNSTFMTISWDYKNTTEYFCPVKHYEVSREENWQWVSENTIDTSVSLSNLLPGGVIKFKIRAYTSNGFAPYSETATISTKLEDPGPVQSLSFEHEDNYELIEWYPPENFESENLGYLLNIQCRRRIGCTSGCNDSDSFDLRVTSTTAKVYSLLPFTQYLFKISANGGPSTSILIGTEMSAPTEIVKPSLLPPVRTNHSVTVFWEAVEVCSGYFKGYVYQLDKADDLRTIATGFTQETRFTVDDLSPNTAYLVKIFIKTGAGIDKDKYLLLNLSTSATVPEAVENLSIYKRGRNILGLRWKQPKKLYGTLKSFIISYGYGNNSKVVTVPPVPCIIWPHFYCHTLENLSPIKKYSVSVAARNTEVTEDGIPTSVSEMTREGTAGAPENVTVVNATSTSFAVSWKYPSMANGVIRSFVISIEEVEQYETEKCCQIFPLVETAVEEELPNYTAEVSGLHPASTYTVSLSAKTISFGPSVTLTLYTRPPPMPLQYLPNVTMTTLEEWEWLPQILLENVNNSKIYQALIKGSILLVVQNSTSDNFLSGIEHEQLNTELKKYIKTDFYFVAEYSKGDIVFIGNFESSQTEWGTLTNPDFIFGQTYQLAAVQISEYCGIFNIDVVYSSTFTAL